MVAVVRDTTLLSTEDSEDDKGSNPLEAPDGQVRASAVGRAAVAGTVVLLGLVALLVGMRDSLRVARTRGAIEAFATEPCLCIFDIDRTLTGKQGWAQQCEGDLELGGVQDTAYAQGTMIVSDLAQHMNSTFCKECYRGIVTAGQASGPNSPERAEILKDLGGVKFTRSDWWQDVAFKPDTEVRTSLVVQASDGSKQDSVLSMLNWWKHDQHIDFKKENVHFFDDIAGNVQPFEGTGLNARQVSCKSRGPKEFPGQWDGKIGGCGGRVHEVVSDKGVQVCPESA